MATEAQISAIADAVIESFNADPALWKAFLVRARLQTQIAELEAAGRNLRENFQDNTEAFNEALTANQAAQAAKLAEIDAL